MADGSAVTSFKVSKNTSDNEGSKDNNGNKDNSNDNPNSNPAAVLMTRKLMTVTVEIIQTTASR